MQTKAPVLEAEPPVLQAELSVPQARPPRCPPHFTLQVSAFADNSSVVVNTTVHLTGTAEVIETMPDCSEETSDAPFTWFLGRRPLTSPAETDISSNLQGRGTLTPFFMPDIEGIYRAKLRAGGIGRSFKTAVVEITAKGGRQITLPGKVSQLSVNEIGDDSSLFVDSTTTEVSVALNSSTIAFGFQVRNDRNRPAHQGMLDILRDAFNNNWTITIEYFTLDDINGLIKRVALTK